MKIKFHLLDTNGAQKYGLTGMIFSIWLIAIGIQVGKFFSWDREFSARFPFVVSHGLTSGIIAFSLNRFGGLSFLASNLAAGFYGMQSIRIVHSRTARYHSLLELFLSLGLLFIGFLKELALTHRVIFET